MDELQTYALEEGKRPSVLKPAPDPGDEVPPALDARTLAAIRRRAEELQAPEPAPSSRAFFKPGLALATAASVLFAVIAFWLAGGNPNDSAPEFAIVRAIGAVQSNGITRTESLSPGGTLDLAQGSLVYIAANPDLIVRLRGPARARFAFAEDTNTQTLHLESGKLELLSGPQRKPDAHPFQIRTSRARYNLLGTMLQLSSDPDGDEIVVLDGRVAVNRAGNEVGIVDAGFQLSLPEPGRSQRLTTDRRESLARTRLQLARFDVESAESNPNMSLEEIRAMHGGLSEFRMSDGRNLRGFLIVRDASSLVVTPEGEIPIDQNEIEEFHVLD